MDNTLFAIFTQYYTYIFSKHLHSLTFRPFPAPFLLPILFRTEDREFAPRLKTAENANIQPNPGLILRAEPTVTNILKVENHNLT